MMTIKINEYITVSYTNATWKKVEAQMREEQIENELWDYMRELQSKMRAAKNDEEFYELWNVYSDVHKDVHGVRPRNAQWFKTY